MAKDRQIKPVRKQLPRKGSVVIEASAASVFGPAAAGVQRLLLGLGKLRGMRAPRDEIAGVLLVVLGLLGLLSLSGMAAGSWLRVLAQTLRVWMGVGALLLPASALGVGAALFARAAGLRFRINWWRVIAGELGVVAVLGLLHLREAALQPTQSLRLAVESGLLVDAALAGLGGGKVGWAMLTLAGLLAPESTGGLLGGFAALMLVATSGLNWRHVINLFIALQQRLLPPVTKVAVLERAQPRKRRASAAASPPAAADVVKRFRVAPLVEAPAKLRKRDPILPSFELLDHSVPQQVSEAEINRKTAIIERTLREFDVQATVIDYLSGPTVTQFAVQPGFVERAGPDGVVRRQKVRIAQISGLANDLALTLAAGSLRIQAPVPGQSYVGIEVPNQQKSFVNLRGVMESAAFNHIESPLKIALGRDVSGAAVAADLGAMPHLLIAGTTGAGKSVCIAALITGLVMNNTPEDLRLVLVDPKRVELIRFNGLPHLLGRVEVELERIVGTLRWIVREMERRYKKFEEYRVRDLDGHNRKVKRHKEEYLPRIVVVIDELADLMMLAQDEVERNLARLAQMARATGIHLVVATQRPSTDILTGLIKANFPARISFSVASAVDSRVVLDSVGAEALLGQGDMLFLSPDAPAAVRLQGVYVSDAELEQVVQHWVSQSAEQAPAAAVIKPAAETAAVVKPAAGPEAPWDALLAQQASVADKDNLIAQAIALVKMHRTASASLLQRKLKLGYPRAARLMDELEEMGIIGREQSGGKTREVLLLDDDAEAATRNDDRD